MSIIGLFNSVFEFKALMKNKFLNKCFLAIFDTVSILSY